MTGASDPRTGSGWTPGRAQSPDTGDAHSGNQVRYLRYDDNVEDLQLVAALRRRDPGVQDRYCSTAANVRDLITRPGKLTVLSSHGSDRSGVWGFRRRATQRRSTPLTITGGSRITARVLVVAACDGAGALWAPVLSPATIAFVAKGNVRYSTVRQSLLAFFPFVQSEGFAASSHDEIEAAWAKAQVAAAAIATRMTVVDGVSHEFDVVRHVPA